LLSDDFQFIPEAAIQIYNSWVERLRMFLGAEVVGNFSIEALWNETSVIDSPVGDYMSEVSCVAYIELFLAVNQTRTSLYI